MKKVFSQGQIIKLLGSETSNKRIRWLPEDITSAISLRSVSPKAYRYLRDNNYPLSALSTLRKWVLNIDISPGIFKTIINLMNNKADSFTEIERLCVISFDEMYISNKIDIDKKNEQVIGPHTTCQTVVVRGLVSKWKQPIFYKFDQPMTNEILEEIISKLYKAKFIVIAIANDMCTGNIALWLKLNVGHDGNCFFNHPCDDSLQIFVYDDDYLEALLNISTTELTFVNKLTPHHLELKGTMRQKVRPAVQIFSNSVAKAIEYCGPRGLMPKDCNWLKAEKIIQLFNDWYDLLNSRCKFVGNCPGRNAFGTDLENQKQLLHKKCPY